MERVDKSDAAGGKARVGLVHHNALIREGLRRILEGGHFRVVWQAAEGPGLVERLGEDPAGTDVMLLEWETPGVGASLVETLVKSAAGIPIVIISRPDTPNPIAPALEAGAVGCLSVDMSASEFLSALRMLSQGDVLVSHQMLPAVDGSSKVDTWRDVLTPREIEVLRALGRGLANREIADELTISPHTVKIHVRRLFAKMGFRNRQEAAAYAAARRIL